MPERNGLDMPRGFGRAPLDARRNYGVGSEDSLRLAMREAARNGGGVIDLNADFDVTSSVLVDTDRVVINGNRHCISLSGDASLVFDVQASQCVFRDIVVGSLDDAVVPGATGFSVDANAEMTMIDNCAVRCSTFLSDAGTLTYVRGSYRLTTAGGSWAAYTYP